MMTFSDLVVNDFWPSVSWFLLPLFACFTLWLTFKAVRLLLAYPKRIEQEVAKFYAPEEPTGEVKLSWTEVES